MYVTYLPIPTNSPFLVYILLLGLRGEDKIKKMRDDNEFDGLLAKVQVVGSNGIEGDGKGHPRGPRQRRLPAHLSDKVDMSTTGSTEVSDPQNMYLTLRRQMFAVTDRMIGALTERFSSNAPELLAFATVNPGSKSFVSFSNMQPVVQSFS